MSDPIVRFCEEPDRADLAPVTDAELAQWQEASDRRRQMEHESEQMRRFMAIFEMAYGEDVVPRLLAEVRRLRAR